MIFLGWQISVPNIVHTQVTIAGTIESLLNAIYYILVNYDVEKHVFMLSIIDKWECSYLV